MHGPTGSGIGSTSPSGRMLLSRLLVRLQAVLARLLKADPWGEVMMMLEVDDGMRMMKLMMPEYGVAGDLRCVWHLIRRKESVLRCVHWLESGRCSVG